MPFRKACPSFVKAGQWSSPNSFHEKIFVGHVGVLVFLFIRCDNMFVENINVKMSRF